MLLRKIRGHLANPDSQHRQIALGFVWVSLFVFIGKLAGAAKEMAIAWRYGVSATVDAYVFVFNLINWPVSVWFSILAVVLLPLIVRVRGETPDELPRFRAELLGLTLLLGLVLGLLIWLGLPVLLHSGWLNLSESLLEQALYMTNGLVWLAPLGMAISLFSASLLAAGHHRNTLFEAIPALVLLFALLLPPDWFPEPLLWGTVAGFAFHAAALGVPLLHRGDLVTPRLAQRSPAWRFFWASIGLMSVGQVLMSFTNLIDQFFAVNLGQGELAALSYSNRILSLILSLGATAISRATLPVFSTAHTKDDSGVGGLALRWAWMMAAFGVVVVVIGWILTPWVVQSLFQRGAFTTENTYQVAELLRYSLIQVPVYGFSLTLVSLIASQRRYSILLLSGVIGLIVKLIFAVVLIKTIGLVGLVLSTFFVYLANGFFFYYSIKVYN